MSNDKKFKNKESKSVLREVRLATSVEEDGVYILRRGMGLPPVLVTSYLLIWVGLSGLCAHTLHMYVKIHCIPQYNLCTLQYICYTSVRRLLRRFSQSSLLMIIEISQ